MTKKIADTRPRSPTVQREAGRLDALIERRRAVATRERTQALLHIATAVAANYRREKQERGLLDYDDLIARRWTMLTAARRAGCITSSTGASTMC